MFSTKKQSAVGPGMILLATLIWGTSFFILKNTIDALPVCFVLGLRFLIAFAVLAAVNFKKLKMSKQTFLQGLLLGAVLAAAYLIQTFGLFYTTPAKNSFLTATYVIIVPFISWLFYKKRPSRYNVIAAVLSFSGILLVSFGGGEGVQIGDLITVACGIFYALQIIYLNRFGNKDNVSRLVIVETGTVGVVCMLLSLIIEIPSGNVSVSSDGWLSILYLALIATCLAQRLQAAGQRYVSSERASLVLSLEAVFGTVFSAIFYHEVLKPYLIIGFIIIFAAIIISETQLSFLFRKKSGKRSGEERSPTADETPKDENAVRKPEQTQEHTAEEKQD